MARLRDWERRLGDYLREPGRDRFSWGDNDCALFACGAVLAMTGEHPFPEFVGAYDTQRGAAEALRRLGKGTLRATWETKFIPKPPAFAQRGDIVANADGAMGVCLGADALFLTENDGFARLPRSAFVAAWEV